VLPYFLDEKVLRVETIYQVLELEEKTLSYADKKKEKKVRRYQHISVLPSGPSNSQRTHIYQSPKPKA